jgi:hypothetical protein
VPEADCGDGVDNDLDGATDCLDSDCTSTPACVPEADCGDGVDNDLDGDTDCGDTDCASAAACVVSGNDSCTAPFVLPDDPNGTWRGTIDALTDNETGTCGGGGGRDAVFQFTTTARATISASLEGSTYDTVLYLRDNACTPGRPQGCNDDSSGTVTWSAISTTENANTFWLFVDAADASTTGSYVLTITVTP